jgi:dTDP-4-dehydrorhamnose reductase
MYVNQPDNVEATYVVRNLPPLKDYVSLDCENFTALKEFLDEANPDAIVNLAGQNNVDIVEDNPREYEQINSGLPLFLVEWCDGNDAHLVQASTQGVFSGDEGPYSASSPVNPITSYGAQKAIAEELIQTGDAWTIARLTFVIGTRPFPGYGRMNPLEDMFERDKQIQVNDHFFSPLLAQEAAETLWDFALRTPGGIHHLGIDTKVSRFQLAQTASKLKQMTGHQTELVDVAHDYFASKGVAKRPADTTWDRGSIYTLRLDEAVEVAFADWTRIKNRNIKRRAFELALFFGISVDDARGRLEGGFFPAHHDVAEDFREHDTDVNDDKSLLAWYLQTDKYIWELSAYHLDAGFNYKGMCDGITTRLSNEEKNRVLCMGDGIGDLTMDCWEAGLRPTYHDLDGSLTSQFAKFRFALNMGTYVTNLTDSWTPPVGEDYDCVVALDFFEHLVNVDVWAQATYDMLRTGGYFMAQNAFAIGDAEHGDSIPMHLSVNNKYEKEWGHLLQGIGFEHMVAEWWQKT